MNLQERDWIIKCRTCRDKFRIDVDNDSVFVTDLESGECVFEFRHFGWEMLIDLLRYIGCNANATCSKKEQIRLIDADKLEKLYKGWLPQLILPEDEKDKQAIETCIAVLEDAPTIDPESLRPQGEWVNDLDENGFLCSAWRKCSSCGALNYSKKPPYCPNCGAKMKGAGENA